MQSVLYALIATSLITSPDSVELQGRLSSAGGQAVNGSYAFTVSLYPSKTAKAPVWQKIFPDVKINDGVFSVMLPNVGPTVEM